MSTSGGEGGSSQDIVTNLEDNIEYEYETPVHCSDDAWQLVMLFSYSVPIPGPLGSFEYLIWISRYVETEKLIY